MGAPSPTRQGVQLSAVKRLFAVVAESVSDRLCREPGQVCGIATDDKPDQGCQNFVCCQDVLLPATTYRRGVTQKDRTEGNPCGPFLRRLGSVVFTTPCVREREGLGLARACPDLHIECLAGRRLGERDLHLPLAVVVGDRRVRPIF
jgi:hypothetical protein